MWQHMLVSAQEPQREKKALGPPELDLQGHMSTYVYICLHMSNVGSGAGTQICMSRTPDLNPVNHHSSPENAYLVLLSGFPNICQKHVCSLKFI